MDFLPFCYNKFPPEIQRKAELELKETPEIKEKSLNEFRQMITAQKDIHSRMDDVFLLRFLRAKKYNVQKALKVLRNYYTFGTKHAGVYARKTPTAIRHVLEMKYACVLRQRLAPGSHVIVFHLGRFDLKKAKHEDIVVCHGMIAEMCLQYEISQVCGGVYIMDFKGGTTKHFTQFLNFSFAKLIWHAVKDSWPERVRSFHFTNVPHKYLKEVCRAKSYLPKKFADKIHLYGNDLTALHSHIPKELLPEEFGGTAEPYDEKDYVDVLMDQESYFQQINKYGMI